LQQSWPQELPRKNLPLRGDVIITAVADEEFASIGTVSIVKRWHADAAIVTEPTELNILYCSQRLRLAGYRDGRSCCPWSSRPDLGVDAIVKMGKVLVGLEELDRSLHSAPSTAS